MRSSHFQTLIFLAQFTREIQKLRSEEFGRRVKNKKLGNIVRRNAHEEPPWTPKLGWLKLSRYLFVVLCDWTSVFMYVRVHACMLQCICKCRATFMVISTGNGSLRSGLVALLLCSTG
ncbi:hypothetical protein BofuT4_P120380.1 [Botrytis cinerea T4]|uniref:Uncharacterized protein n=1 Tax=Botryotinia fuckeliana (strain T4) TaxID=999810 RepID=G2XXZ5_BOTF4|nr:hypothetical protein BofuT4_P120380.1 [Botrytis cinerea T4]